MELLQLTVDDFPPEDGSVAGPSKELISSIALRGQLVPMIVEVDRQHDDFYRISDGRRRKLAIDAINKAHKEDGFGAKLMPYWVVVMETDKSESNMRVDVLHTLTANLLRREKRQDLLAGLPTVQAARPEILLAGQLEGFAQRATLSSEQRQILDRAVDLLKSLHGG